MGGGQSNTHVSNGFGSPITVVVTHPDGRNDKMVLGPGEVRNVETTGGQVKHIL